MFIGNAPDSAGIYLIIHRTSCSIYVGQSVRIRTRLEGHYEHLTTQTHHNHGLQGLWNTHPPETFETHAYQVCPAGLSPLERQRWLVKAEREAIQKATGKANVLNQAEPEIVETPDALFEFQQSKEIRAASISRERRALKIRIDELDNLLAPMRSERRDCSFELVRREDDLKKSKSLLRFFRGPASPESVPRQEERLAALKKRIQEIDDVIAPIGAQRAGLFKEYQRLYGSFPKVIDQLSRRHERSFAMNSGRKKPTITERNRYDYDSL